MERGWRFRVPATFRTMLESPGCAPVTCRKRNVFAGTGREFAADFDPFRWDSRWEGESRNSLILNNGWGERI
jgi:hypothetical protein